MNELNQNKPTHTAKTAIAYIYTALDQSKDEEGTARQTQAIQAKSQELGVEVIKTFEDHGIKGTALRRPNLLKLIEYVNKNAPIDYVVIENHSRLARKTEEIEEIVALIEQNGTKIVSNNS
jgi:DNA invertase Pin-like site-specific DNA recombinase